MKLPRPLRWGGATAVGSFLPVVVGLLTANPAPTWLAWALGVIAALAAGGIGAAQSVVNSQEKDKLDTQFHDLAGAHKALDRVKSDMALKMDELQVDRVRSTAAIRASSESLLAIMTHQDIRSVYRHVDSALEAFHRSLVGSDSGGRSSVPGVCVSFLQFHGGYLGLPEASVETHGSVKFSVVSCYGSDVFDGIGRWRIADSDLNYKVAVRVYEGEPPWQRGGVLVRDLSLPSLEDYAVLCNPHIQSRVKSYCRVPMAVRGAPIGFLCVDADTSNFINRETFLETIVPYSSVICSAFAAYGLATDAWSPVPEGEGARHGG